MKKLLLALWPFTLLSSEPDPFALERPEKKNVIEVKSGLYAHREIELRVNAARLNAPPAGVLPGATAELATTRFFPLGSASAGFIPTAIEKRGDDLVWTEITHLSKDDFMGQTSRGAEIRWSLDGEETVSDGMEIFELPKPEINQIGNWSEWSRASSRRSGIFAWHAEANKQEREEPPEPAFPFQMRFRLTLSERMYP